MHTTQQVQLKVNEASMIKSFRHAFANHFTCVQELIQNARRAGATLVEVNYDPDSLELEISDNGRGVTDFAALLDKGNSGWDEATIAQEHPYGLGFLSAIYAAQEVSIASNGKILTFKTSDALNQEHLVVQDHETAQGTTVILKGFKWDNPQQSMESMALGYPIAIRFNGVDQLSPCAVSEAFASTPVGQISLKKGDYTHGILIYLQGFQVYPQQPLRQLDLYRCSVVHLDPVKYRGKFPDRSCVIDEEMMLDDVKAQVKALYTERLLAMKATMEPAQFCEEATALASVVGRMDVFNDVDVLPASWLDAFYAAPHDYTVEGQGSGFLQRCEKPVSRADVQSGRVRLAELHGFYAGDDHELFARWLYAWASGCLMLMPRLDEGHWVYQHLLVKSGTAARIEIVGEGQVGTVGDNLASVAYDDQIVLCDRIEVCVDDVKLRIMEPVGMLKDEEGFIYVPRLADGKYPEQIDASVPLRQIHDYVEDDESLDADFDQDRRLFEDAYLQMNAYSMEQRIAISLERALKDLYSLRGQQFTIGIARDGSVEVSDLVELPNKG